jgi:putative colanic acid biosynthesis acetyltransferase WcaF
MDGDDFCHFIESPADPHMRARFDSSDGYFVVGSWSLSQSQLSGHRDLSRSSLDTLVGTAATPTDNSQLRVDLTKSNTPWPFSTKMRRGLWNVVWQLLFRHTPKRLCNPWRVWLLALFGADIQGKVLVLGSCKILQPWKLSLGNGSALGSETVIYNYAHVRIGAMTIISQYSYLCTGTHDYTHPHMPLTWAPICIGSECWIAAGVFVAPGVTIGRGTVVGARSVVTRDLPEWTICAGNPCKALKPRVMRPLSHEDR